MLISNIVCHADCSISAAGAGVPPDACVGHDYVERAQCGHSVLERCAKTLEVPHIGLGGDDAATRLLNQGRGIGEVGL
jgi:hypothetical protein